MINLLSKADDFTQKINSPSKTDDCIENAKFF